MKLKENTQSPDSLRVQNDTQHAKDSRVPNKHTGTANPTFWMLLGCANSVAGGSSAQPLLWGLHYNFLHNKRVSAARRKGGLVCATITTKGNFTPLGAGKGSKCILKSAYLFHKDVALPLVP